jgi:hypothetical protein
MRRPNSYLGGHSVMSHGRFVTHDPADDGPSGDLPEPVNFGPKGKRRRQRNRKLQELAIHGKALNMMLKRDGIDEESAIEEAVRWYKKKRRL